MRKTLLFLASFLFCYNLSFAEYCVGSYDTKIISTMNGSSSESTNTVTIEESGETVNLSISDFSVSGFSLGTIVFSDVKPTEENGICTIKNTNTISLMFQNLPAELDLIVSDDEVSGTITISSLNVVCTLSSSTSDVSEIRDSKPSVFYHNGTITTESVSEGKNYKIYSVTGVAIQSGIIKNSSINISLKKGLYFICIDEKVIKFIAK